MPGLSPEGRDETVHKIRHDFCSHGASVGEGTISQRIAQ